MGIVRVAIQNSKYGLHNGHRELIRYGKSLGDVIVCLAENLMDRNNYLVTGAGKPHYKINDSQFAQDCQDLGVKYKKPYFIVCSEAKRKEAYAFAKGFADQYAGVLLADRYIMEYTSQLIREWFLTLGVRARENRGDIYLSGPDVISFFWKYRTEQKWPMQRVIWPNIVRDDFGLKLSTSSMDITFDKTLLRQSIDGWKPKYKVGKNEELVKELNASYSEETVGWRVNDILVYEGGFVPGRLEVTSIRYSTGPLSYKLFEELEYHA